MTLETAKRLVEEGRPEKEAEAVVRGGMYICENTANGSRKYIWIKVNPTITDAESSIDAAMESYRRRSYRRPQKTVTKPKQQEVINTPAPQITEEQEIQTSFIERLKKKLKEMWKEIDSIVME